MLTIEDLTNTLGVELEKEFYIYDNGTKSRFTSPYKLTKDDLQWYSSYDNMWFSSHISILEFFTGKYTIIKKPWKPKHFDKYYYISSNGDVECSEWHGDNLDLTFYASKNCFRTRKEAEIHKDKLIANIKSIYEKG